MFGFNKKAKKNENVDRYDAIIRNAEKNLSKSRKMATSMSVDTAKLMSFTNEMLAARR